MSAMIRMRPHTRTQCQDGNQCPECRDTGPVAGSSMALSSTLATVSTATASATTASSGDPFVAPASVGSRRSLVQPGTSKNIGDGEAVKRATLLVELPAEILFKILTYMSFKEISHLRLVSHHDWLKQQF